jgi:tRNA threonylcarbamoyladenosine biosynthesis protein TsaB
MPAIQQLVDAADLKPEDIGAIAVSVGPGSFTGLRIGITTAKSMAFALGVPVIGVPTLDVIAAQYAYSGKLIYPILDAQKGNVYTALYDTTGAVPTRLDEYRVLAIQELLDEIVQRNQSSVIAGEISDFAEQLAEVPTFVQIASPLNRMPRAATVATLGLQQLLNGGGQDPRVLTPFYIRRSEAEVLWEQRHGGGECNEPAISKGDA